MGLVEKKFFDWASGGGEKFCEIGGSEIGRDGVHPEAGDGGAGFDGVVDEDAAEVAAVGETEDAFVEFEGDVHVNVSGRFFFVGDGEHFFCVGEPEKLAIEFEMESDDAAIELKPEVFSVALDELDALAFGEARELRRILRFCDDGMEDVNAADFATLDERAKSLRDGFDFGKFRHERMSLMRISRRALVSACA